MAVDAPGMTIHAGGCLCGAVRYVLHGDPGAVVLCHCAHCRRHSGSMFSVNVVVPQACFELRGEPRRYRDSGDSGRSVWRCFCGECGGPLFTLADAMPGVVIVKAGTLDDVPAAGPAVEIYVDQAAWWLPRLPGTARFGRSRPAS